MYTTEMDEDASCSWALALVECLGSDRAGTWRLHDAR